MDRNAVVALHTALTFLGWSILFPLGVYIASFEKGRLSNWMVVYQGVLYSAAALLSIAYIIFMVIGLYNINNAYNICTHIAMSWLLLHMIALTVTDNNQKKTTTKKLLQVSGYLLTIFGIALVAIGLYDQPWADQSVGIAYGLYALTVLVVFLWAKMHVDLERHGHLQMFVVGPPPSIVIVPVNKK